VPPTTTGAADIQLEVVESHSATVADVAPVGQVTVPSSPVTTRVVPKISPAVGVTGSWTTSVSTAALAAFAPPSVRVVGTPAEVMLVAGAKLFDVFDASTRGTVRLTLALAVSTGALSATIEDVFVTGCDVDASRSDRTVTGIVMVTVPL